ncbi:MAG: FAD-dependent oxidoreductase [Desulfotomaculaceae bacterium]
MSELLPPCTNACPVHTDVRGYLAAIARRDYNEAFRLISANNPFPSVCAWVCPHPCEEACRRAVVDAPIAIKDLKRFAVEMAGPGHGVFPHVPRSGKKVAVAGAGPAGLTAAYNLTRLGHKVVVFDRLPSPGGHFLTSLPTYRLPREALSRDIEKILAAGVEFRPGVDVGRDITVERLKKENDAVIISTGLWANRGLNLPGFDHPAVLSALAFLKAANAGEETGIGGRVVVIGGGDVAMDAARTAVRLGAPEVLVVCLESLEQMPAHVWEIEEARAEGVTILPGYGPVEVLTANNSITGLTVQKVNSVFDREGKFNPIYDPVSFKTVLADTVILCIGQMPDNSFLAGNFLATARGGLAVDKRFLTTSADGIFACGELTFGSGPAIEAIASGYRAALAVEHYFNGEKIALDEQEAQIIGPLPEEIAAKIPRSERKKAPLLPPEERGRSFLPYELGLEEKAALSEADRCLKCGLGASVNNEKCAACLNCQRACPYKVPVVDGHASMPVESCQACGICAAVCPAQAIEIGVLDEEAILLKLDSLCLKGKVAVFTCRAACVDSPDLAELGETPDLKQTCIIEMPSAGMLRLEWLLKAFENGAAGVAVVVCGKDQCRCYGGFELLEGVIARAGELLSAAGIRPEQLYHRRLAGGESPVSLLREFAGQLP